MLLTISLMFVFLKVKLRFMISRADPGGEYEYFFLVGSQVKTCPCKLLVNGSLSKLQC